MADQDVNIRVNQTSSGNAVSEMAAKIEALKQKIAELNQLEKNYAAKGIPSAAASVRQERIPYARELRDLQREQRRANTEQQQHERQVTKEHKEREAVEKAKETRLRTLGRAAISYAEGQVGVGGLGGITSALGGMGGIPAMLATVAVAAVAKVASAYHNDAYEREGIANRGEARRSRDDRSARILGGWRGSGAQATAAMHAAEDEMTELLRKRKELERQARPGFWDPRLWSNNLLGTNYQTWSGQRAIAENEEEIRNATRNRTQLNAVRKEKFSQEGGQEIAAQRARVEGNFKEAISIDLLQEARRRYLQLRTEGGDADQAREGAGLSLKQRQLDVMRGLGSLAGARDGRANIAALASVGSGLSMQGVEQRLDRVIQSAEGQFKSVQAKQAAETHARK